MQFRSSSGMAVGLSLVLGLSVSIAGAASAGAEVPGRAAVPSAPTATVLVKATPRAGSTVWPRRTVTLRFNKKVRPTTATIKMGGLSKTRPARLGSNSRELKVRLPKNLAEGRKVAVIVPAKGSGSRLAKVVYRAGFKLAATGNGTLVVSGTDPARGTSGPIIRYTLEVQTSLRGRAGALVDRATKVLGNQRRGWTAIGQRRLKRVSNPSRANIRVLLAKPAMVDALCARTGLDTAGIYSCWNSEYAALNLMRWDRGAPGFKSMKQYRNYLVNHEFGHGLGYAHVRCTVPGTRAPVMEQQTISLRGCRAYGWPYRP